MRIAIGILALLLLLLAGPFAVATLMRPGAIDWRTANRQPTNILPDPATTPEPVVAILAARAWGWRGAFSLHTWIVLKDRDAPAYDRFEVVGWGVQTGQQAVRRNMRLPDAAWAGNPPEIVRMFEGDAAAAAIPKLLDAVQAYPYPRSYVIWPGPNSNSFVAYLVRQVPELATKLPSNAVGKDWIAGGIPIAPAPSRTGLQFSLFGVFGFTIAADEGLELNILGLVLGIDPLDLAIKIPGFGRLSLRS